jgi:hypothetical protein
VLKKEKVDGQFQNSRMEIEYGGQPTAKVRCGVCSNCLLIEQTKHLLMPNPPFSHANQQTVDVWNHMLETHPCTSIRDANLTETEQPTKKDKSPAGV